MLRRKDFDLMVEFFVSCAMSLLWVGFYGYTYNVPFLNSPMINWLAFFLWGSGLFFTLRVYRLFCRIVRPFWMRVVLVWLTYFSGLLVVEYLGYYVFRIRQVTSEGPLLFGLIHGTAALKIYYIFAGICAVMLSSALKGPHGYLRPGKKSA